MSARFVLDGYCGAGGWDEGARMLGLGPVVGVDNWVDACRTGAAAGHTRICADVSTYPTAPFAGRVSGLVMSPPCQAWSTAGAGLGRADRVTVHALVDRMAAGDDDWSWHEWADDRSHHTAQPVRWVRDLHPDWVCLEQVPEVLPLWKHIGWVLAGWGYSVWVGVLNAADFGVPQTRGRAFLIASADGVARPPEPTHAEHPGDGLFGARLAPWVTMREALGWEGAVRSGQVSQLGRGRTARYERDTARPSPTLTGSADRWRVLDRPARTVCGARSPRWAFGVGARSYGTGETLDGVPVGVREAAILQGFRPDYPWWGGKGSQFAQVANAVPPPLAAAVLSAATGVPLARGEVRVA